MEKKRMFQLMLSYLCILLFVTYSSMRILALLPSLTSVVNFPTILSAKQPLPRRIVETYAQSNVSTLRPPSVPRIPRLAYSISGTKGDLDGLWRLLRAIYHPRNAYIVHLDMASPATERKQLMSRVKHDAVFAKVGNVHVIVKPNIVTYRGPTMIANTLHACAILLRKSHNWDWFINLSASDYPLMTQDG